MGDIKRYWKKKLTNQNLEVEYSSEEDEITIRYVHKLKMGASIGTDYLKIHPSYVEPLYQLLKEVTVEEPKQEEQPHE